jgi:transcriptional regulator GlxA family with amidase domain
MEHPAESLPVERLAEIAGVSARSVARLFTSELGVTPHDFVESVRVDRARNLLEATALALKAAAYDSGFKNAEQMRLVFLRRLGVSPVQYREKFRAATPRTGGPRLHICASTMPTS